MEMNKDSRSDDFRLVHVIHIQDKFSVRDIKL